MVVSLFKPATENEVIDRSLIGPLDLLQATTLPIREGDRLWQTIAFHRVSESIQLQNVITKLTWQHYTIQLEIIVILNLPRGLRHVNLLDT